MRSQQKPGDPSNTHQLTLGKSKTIFFRSKDISLVLLSIAKDIEALDMNDQPQINGAIENRSTCLLIIEIGRRVPSASFEY